MGTKVRLREIEATIPTVQYGNIKPVVEIEGDLTDEARDEALSVLKKISDMTAGDGFTFDVRGLAVASGRTQMVVADDVKTYTSELLNDSKDVRIHNGHKSLEGYLSGSKFPEKFYAPFDSQSILNAIVEKFGVTAGAVAAMWKLNNEASTGYGTAIHAVMENFDLNQQLGDTIKSVKTFKTKADEVGPNKALSKNPFLKHIVESFHDSFGDDSKIYTEQFIWDDEFKFCGSIDRLKVVDLAKKVCRIQDYKTDGDIHEKKYQLTTSPFKTKLGSELLDLHWLQLSFYAFIMQRRGWTVEGLDVYWLNPGKLVSGESPWEEFSHDVVDISEGVING